MKIVVVVVGFWLCSFTLRCSLFARSCTCLDGVVGAGAVVLFIINERRRAYINTALPEKEEKVVTHTTKTSKLSSNAHFRPLKKIHHPPLRFSRSLQSSQSFNLQLPQLPIASGCCCPTACYRCYFIIIIISPLTTATTIMQEADIIP